SGQTFRFPRSNWRVRRPGPPAGWGWGWEATNLLPLPLREAVEGRGRAGRLPLIVIRRRLREGGGERGRAHDQARPLPPTPSHKARGRIWLCLQPDAAPTT